MTLISILFFQLQPMTYATNKNQQFYVLIHWVCTMTFHYQGGTTAWRSCLIFLQIPLCTSRDQVVPKPQVMAGSPLPTTCTSFLWFSSSFSRIPCSLPAFFPSFFITYPLLLLNSRPLRGLTLFTRAFSTISFRMAAWMAVIKNFI